MNPFITLATLQNNGAKHTLVQINDCEHIIVAYELELNKTQEENWRTKEMADLLASQTEKKLALVRHLNECFNLDYNVELHQSLACYKQFLYVIQNCESEDWRNAMWLNEEAANDLCTETKALAEKLKESMIQKHKITSDYLEAAAQ